MVGQCQWHGWPLHVRRSFCDTYVCSHSILAIYGVLPDANFWPSEVFCGKPWLIHADMGTSSDTGGDISDPQEGVSSFWRRLKPPISKSVDVHIVEFVGGEGQIIKSKVWARDCATPATSSRLFERMHLRNSHFTNWEGSTKETYGVSVGCPDFRGHGCWPVIKISFLCHP